ncbi:unnamed protein product [Lepidochelys kempii]
MGHALCACARGSLSIEGQRYLLLQRLGEGGFSYVDLVEGLQDGRFYALKRILCHDKEDYQEALHEVEMHGLFEHPNILRLEAHCMVEKGPKHEALAAVALSQERDPVERGGSSARQRHLPG